MPVDRVSSRAQQADPNRDDACGMDHPAKVEQPDEPARLGATLPPRGKEEADREEDGGERHVAASQRAVKSTEVGSVGQNLAVSAARTSTPAARVRLSRTSLERRQRDATQSTPSTKMPPNSTATTVSRRIPAVVRSS